MKLGRGIIGGEGGNREGRGILFSRPPYSDRRGVGRERFWLRGQTLLLGKRGKLRQALPSRSDSAISNPSLMGFLRLHTARDSDFLPSSQLIKWIRD